MKTKEGIQMIIGTYANRFYNLILNEEINGHRVINLNNATKEEIEKMDILIKGSLRSPEIEKYPALKYIVSPPAGLDGFDVEEIERRGIEIYNHHTMAKYIAEKGLALTLALLGQLVVFHKGLEHKDWNRNTPNGKLYWTSLYQKKLGIYGYGHIGKAYHELVKPFGCKVYTLDRGKEYPSDVHLVNGLDELTTRVDLLFIAVPATEKTINSINKNHLQYMDNKFIINVGRGKVINEEDLYNALSNDVLGGFASDVWYQYPNVDHKDVYPSNYPIHEFKNVVMSPHSANRTFDEIDVLNHTIVRIVKNLLNK